mmetsp:Transcript_49902/g.113336  ORF Transcript_49902/g.113336 Transcript_49902/m.113336 type:complete len:202 (-) Transcript_49902:253-858(-)
MQQEELVALMRALPLASAYGLPHKGKRITFKEHGRSPVPPGRSVLSGAIPVPVDHSRDPRFHSHLGAVAWGTYPTKDPVNPEHAVKPDTVEGLRGSWMNKAGHLALSGHHPIPDRPLGPKAAAIAERKAALQSVGQPHRAPGGMQQSVLEAPTPWKNDDVSYRPTRYFPRRDNSLREYTGDDNVSGRRMIFNNIHGELRHN